jgi:hypothetical protein
MLKTKHNKKRNTAFLYETIIREITKSVIDRDEKRKISLINLCKQHFSNGTELKKELDLYNAINETFNIESDLAERILKEAKLQYDMLNKQKLFNEQTTLINALNKLTSGKIFSVFVPHYKNLATISQVFNNSIPIKEKVLLENTLIKKMSSSPEEIESSKLEAIDALTYKLFVKKFNEQYNDSLLNEQKELITKYVMSFADNGLEFKLFLNEEIERLKIDLKNSLNKKEILNDHDMKEKTNQILNKVDTYKQKEINIQMIQEVLKIQNLVKEINFEETQPNG